MKIRNLVLLAAMFLSTSLTWAQGGATGVGGGGDIYAAEFKRIARELVTTMASNGIQQVGGVSIRQFRDDIEGTSIETTPKELKLENVRKDAINYPQDKKIVLSLMNWPTVRSLLSKRQIVLHEFFGIAGIPDAQYQNSNQVLDQLQRVLKTQDNAAAVDTLKADLATWVQYVLPITSDYVNTKSATVACARLGFFSGAFEYGIFEEIRQVALQSGDAQQSALLHLNSEMEDIALSLTSYCDDSDTSEIDHAVKVGDKKAETKLIQSLISDLNTVSKLVAN